MLGPAWIALLRRIPASYHDGLAVTLVTGAEIIVQSLLRLEPDFVILRGRMAGSTDPARVVVLPFNQIVNVAFLKRMLEAEVATIFGELQESAAAVDSSDGSPQIQTRHEHDGETPNGITDSARISRAPTFSGSAAAPKPPGQASAAPLSLSDSQASEVSVERSKSSAPSKSIFLERLRARLADIGK